MSSYNYNVQISLAQSNATSREQDKIKKAPKTQEENADVILKKTTEEHEKVSAVPNDENSPKVHNDKDEKDTQNSDAQIKLQKQDTKEEKNVEIVVDDKKGKKVNIVC